VSDPLHSNGWTLKTLREELTGAIEANDRRYEQRFADSQTAIAAALAGVKLGGDAALVAQKEAAGKSEVAAEKRFEQARIETDLRLNELSRQIGDLKGGLSGLGGRTTGMREMWGYIVGVGGLLLAVASYFANRP
jgi:hypothetical protein